MDDKLRRIISQLTTKSRGGAIDWQDVSNLSSGDRFRAIMGEVMIELSKGEIQHNATEPDSSYVDYYSLQILNNRALVIDETRAEVGDPHYRLFDDLYHAARAAVRNRDQVLDQLLQTLEK